LPANNNNIHIHGTHPVLHAHMLVFIMVLLMHGMIGMHSYSNGTLYSCLSVWLHRGVNLFKKSTRSTVNFSFIPV